MSSGLSTFFRSRAQKALTFVLLTLLLRLVANLALPLLHLPTIPLFFTPADIFADSIKSGLALRAITAPLLTDPRVAHWPMLFRDYLFHNPYVSPTFSNFWLPPLSRLQLMAVAELMVVASPWAALGTEVSLYALGVFALAVLIVRLRAIPAHQALSLAVLFILSYPALYMLNRANFHSGYASLCLSGYFFTTVLRRWRLLGLALLAYAINVRPNTAVVTLLEFALAPGLLCALRWQVLAAVLAASVFGLALFTAHRIDPAYSFSAFIHAYGLYHADYVVGEDGTAWNDSLYGAVKVLREMAGISPAYSPQTFAAVSVFGAVTLLVVTGLALMRWLLPAEAVFAAAATCTLFTPVADEYHVLMFAGVLAAALLARVDGEGLRLEGIWPSYVALAFSACAADLFPSATMATLLVVAATFVGLWLARMDRATTVETVSLLALAPLGGQYGNGTAIALLLSATLVALCLRAVMRIDPKGSRALGKKAGERLSPFHAGTSDGAKTEATEIMGKATEVGFELLKT